jgi:hypothetical protein
MERCSTYNAKRNCCRTHNALERGEPLEHAIQTFVNAGYNPQEVQAAAQFLVSEGVSSIIATSDTKVPQKPKNVEDNAPYKTFSSSSPGIHIFSRKNRKNEVNLF